MTSRAESWYHAIAQRHSCRQFDHNRPMSEETLERLRSICGEFRPYKSARAELVTESVDGVFRGLIGGYGKIAGAKAFLAFVGDTTAANVQERVGYTGEGIVLEATSMGLGTCWVAGSFNPGVVRSLLKLGDNETVLAVSPVGYASGKSPIWDRAAKGLVKSSERLPLQSLVIGAGIGELPDWTKDALNSARLAPSAKNRQPWTFEVAGDSITVSVKNGGDDSGISKRLDCGIAMLHLEVAITNAGVNGKWEFLDGPQVARFKIQAEDKKSPTYRKAKR